jgi:hypothetical protein
MATGKGAAADNEIPSSCAYNFPAVVLTVGKDGWPHLDEVCVDVHVCIYICICMYVCMYV